MSNSIKNNWFPVLSVIAGVVVTVLCAGLMERMETPAPETQAAINKFDQLEAGQQQRLLTQAAGFESKDPAYKERIISIHQAVAADPTLESKLRTLHSWWRPMNPTQKEKIRSYEDDAAKWASEVQRAYVEDQVADNVIVIRVPRPPLPTGERPPVDLTEAQFEEFLRFFISEPPPSGLADKLSGFEPNENCEITLTKIVWVTAQMHDLFGQMRRPPPQRPPGSIFDAIQPSELQHLFDPDEWKLLSQGNFNSRSGDGPSRSEDVQRFQPMWLVSACVWSGIRHYERVFQRKHRGVQQTLNENDDNLMDVFDDGDRRTQLGLMRMDPGIAADWLNLERLRMEREGLNTEDSAVAGLINDLKGLKDLQRRWSFGGRRSMGQGPSIGGGRGEFGRGDREENRGGRDRDEGRGGSRSGGGGPPRDGRPQFR
jgi:hypothetical protein